MNLAQENQSLKAENERLRDQITAYNEANGQSLSAPLVLGLTGMQSRIFCALYKRAFIERNSLMEAMYGIDWYDRSRECIDVQLNKMRKKLALHQIEIKSIYGRGFEMPEASRRIAKALFEAEGTAA
jgi:DNA-binding response OmpR family regulator